MHSFILFLQSWQVFDTHIMWVPSNLVLGIGVTRSIRGVLEPQELDVSLEWAG